MQKQLHCQNIQESNKLRDSYTVRIFKNQRSLVYIQLHCQNIQESKKLRESYTVRISKNQISLEVFTLSEYSRIKEAQRQLVTIVTLSDHSNVNEKLTGIYALSECLSITLASMSIYHCWNTYYLFIQVSRHLHFA